MWCVFFCLCGNDSHEVMTHDVDDEDDKVDHDDDSENY